MKIFLPNLLFLKNVDSLKFHFQVSMASLNHESLATTPGGGSGSGGRTIEVNPVLAGQLFDIQTAMGEHGKQSKIIHPESDVTLNFFVNLAICNTVIVGKPHK